MIEAEQIEFDDVALQTITDVARVKKIYKLNNIGVVNGRGKPNGVDGGAKADERKELETIILGSMALRSATN